MLRFGRACGRRRSSPPLFVSHSERLPCFVILCPLAKAFTSFDLHPACVILFVCVEWRLCSFPDVSLTHRYALPAQIALAGRRRPSHPQSNERRRCPRLGRERALLEASGRNNNRPIVEQWIGGVCLLVT